MSASLFSQSWYQVSDIKARLRQHVVIHRHIYRDKVWYILQDHVTGQFHRFSPEAYQIIGLMDGRRTLQQIWQTACKRLGDDMPTQEDVIQLVSKLSRANVLHSNILPNMEDLSKRQREIKKKKLLQQLKTPLGIRIPLWDPEGFLNATYPLVRPLIGIWGALLWLGVIITGLVFAGINWEPLTLNIQDQLLSLENLLLMALIYPLVKALHELGHAYTVKRWGGEVHEMGIMLLVFIPVPYVDATSASAFRNKYQRMLVGAAGILVEAFIAALAMIVWAYAEPGMARSFAFNVMMIAGFSTLLFNGNPLLRFDAYYVLSDFLEIPNLGARGNQQIGYLVKRYLYGIHDAASPANSYGEAWWMGVYAVAAFLYRLFIMIVISLFVAAEYLLVGVLFAIWSIYATVVAPVAKTLAKPMTDQELKNRKPRTLLIGSVGISALAFLLFVLPLPLATQAEGVIWVPKQAYLRSSMYGFIKQLVKEPGSQVVEGEVLIELEDHGLDAQVAVLSAQLLEARARFMAEQGNRVQTEIIREEIAYLERERELVMAQQQDLKIISHRKGTFILPNSDNLIGRYVTRGAHLGYVVDFHHLPVTAMVEADYIDLVRHQAKSVEVRFASLPNRSYSAEIGRIVPSSTRELPSKVLAVEGGGRIAVDPNAPDGARSLRNYFRVDLTLQDAPISRIEERVYVLFKHDPEPLAWRWYRVIRRVFLRQLDV